MTPLKSITSFDCNGNFICIIQMSCLCSIVNDYIITVERLLSSLRSIKYLKTYTIPFRSIVSIV